MPGSLLGVGLRKEMTVTITCDHRHISGADAAMFLKARGLLTRRPPLQFVLDTQRLSRFAAGPCRHHSVARGPGELILLKGDDTRERAHPRRLRMHPVPRRLCLVHIPLLASIALLACA